MISTELTVCPETRAATPAALAALGDALPALFAPDARTAERFADFFTANIRNKNTRRAYFRAACAFAAWCEARGLHTLAAVKPVHIAAYIETMTAAKPTVKQHLAALRMLFDWLVVGQVVAVNPAHAVRGPKHVIRTGRTPVLDREEARALLAGINASTLTGLRDRALIGVMIYTFARVGAVLQMNVGDYFSQGRRGWVRLHEKGGKEHAAPCVSKLEAYLDEYIAAAGIGEDYNGPLFRTTGRATGTPRRMVQKDAYMMIQRRTKRASAIIPCALRGSPITSSTAGRSNTRSKWRTILPRARRSSMIDGRMRSRLTSMRRSGFSRASSRHAEG
jgi:site-specific recombinase XerD